MKISSLPIRERGSKRLWAEGRGRRLRSLPIRERGSKPPPIVLASRPSSRSPSGSADRNGVSSGLNIATRWSLPIRERGSKHRVQALVAAPGRRSPSGSADRNDIICAFVVGLICVAPHPGARIETTRCLVRPTCGVVAPHPGARIETTMSSTRRSWAIRAVAPHPGARIETALEGGGSPSSTCRSPSGSADRNSCSGVGSGSLPSRSPSGSADRNVGHPRPSVSIPASLPIRERGSKPATGWLSGNPNHRRSPSGSADRNNMALMPG